MTPDYLYALNQGLVKDCILAMIAILITIFYYKKRKTTAIVAFLVAIQYIIEITFIPIKFYYSYIYYWQYLLSSTVASYVIIRLIIEIRFYNLKITIVETGIIILQTFIVLCMGCRFFDRIIFLNSDMSEVYSLISYLAYYLILITLLLPVFKEIFLPYKCYLQYLGFYNNADKRENVI